MRTRSANRSARFQPCSPPSIISTSVAGNSRRPSIRHLIGSPMSTWPVAWTPARRRTSIATSTRSCASCSSPSTSSAKRSQRRGCDDRRDDQGLRAAPVPARTDFLAKRSAFKPLIGNDENSLSPIARRRGGDGLGRFPAPALEQQDQSDEPAEGEDEQQLAHEQTARPADDNEESEADRSDRDRCERDWKPDEVGVKPGVDPPLPGMS